MEGYKDIISDLHKENSSVDNHYKIFKTPRKKIGGRYNCVGNIPGTPQFNACNSVSTAATY